MKRTVDRSSPVPLHSQIKQILIDELQDPDRTAAPVLTENGLIKRFQVSRAPIRQALKGLADEGFVIRHRAKGTFPVRGLNVRLPSAVEIGGLSRYLTEQGMKPTSRVLDVRRVEAPEEVRQALGLEPGEELLHLKRVILVEDSPLVLAASYLRTPPGFLPGKEELERSGTIFSRVEQQLGIVFTHGEQNIWAAGATGEEADALDVKAGDPVLVTVTTMFKADGYPGLWRRAVHRAEDFKYALSINR